MEPAGDPGHNRGQAVVGRRPRIGSYNAALLVTFLDELDQVSDKIFLPRVVGGYSYEFGNHFILWVFDFVAKQIRIYDSLGNHRTISDGDMDLLKNVFRFSGGLEGWTVSYPPQWKQQDTDNCGVLVCSAAENEVLRRETMTEALTLNQCRTLRLYHAAQMLKNVYPEDFPRTTEEIQTMQKKELQLQEEEAKKTDSSSHCLAWKIKACLFQRATGKTSVFHDHIKKYKWVQCKICENWLHFQCAGVKGDLTAKQFFCDCNMTPDLNDILECIQAEDILTDGEIKDLETNLLSGQVLSNRMYLWKNRGLDPALRKYYCQHVSLFNNVKTEDLIQRLERVLSVAGTVAVNQLFITDVILPEVLVLWLQSQNMCRYRAESVLLKCTSSQGKKSDAEITSGDTESTEQESHFLRDIVVAADWCNSTTFDGSVHVPSVLSMEKEEQIKFLENLHSWKGEYDESSPAELFTFVFEKKNDFEKFCTELIDNRNLRLFAKFEKQ